MGAAPGGCRSHILSAALEGQSTSQLDDALGALSPGDLAVVARREGRCRVADTHPVQGIGGFGTELERYSMLEGKGAEDSQIHIAEPRSDDGVARHIAIGAPRANAPGEPRAVFSESRRVVPRRQFTVLGANAATVIELGANARNGVWAVRVRTVIVQVGSCEHIQRRAASHNENRCDLPAVCQYLQERARSVEVVDVPYGGDHRVVRPVSIHRALFLREATADGAQRIIGGGKGIAEVTEILRGHLSDRRLVRAL